MPWAEGPKAFSHCLAASDLHAPQGIPEEISLQVSSTAFLRLTRLSDYSCLHATNHRNHETEMKGNAGQRVSEECVLLIQKKGTNRASC